MRLLPLFDSVPFGSALSKFALYEVVIVSSLKVWPSPPFDFALLKVRIASASRAQPLLNFSAASFNITSFNVLGDNE